MQACSISCQQPHQTTSSSLKPPSCCWTPRLEGEYCHNLISFNPPKSDQIQNHLPTYTRFTHSLLHTEPHSPKSYIHLNLNTFPLTQICATSQWRNHDEYSITIHILWRHYLVSWTANCFPPSSGCPLISKGFSDT